MRLIPTWLRDCLRLQVVDEYEPVAFAPFGRALLKGSDRWGADDTMLYWIRLPSYRFGTTHFSRKERWLQLVLVFHGREGFKTCEMPRLIAP